MILTKVDKNGILSKIKWYCNELKTNNWCLIISEYLYSLVRIMDLDENGYQVIEFVDQNGCVNLEDALVKIRTERPDKINQSSTVYHLILDVETDGIGTFRPPTQTLCEIGWIFLKNGKETERYTSFVKGATKLNNNFPHQFTIKNLNEEGGTPKQALERLQKIVDMYQPTIVAHNIDFDIGILKKTGLRGINKLPRLCTVKRSIKYCKLPSFHGHYKYPKMNELSQRLGCKTRGDHTAMGDCTALLEIFHKGIEQGLWEIDDLKS